MSSEKPVETNPPAAAVEAPSKPKGYTNPALRAMGIPRLRLPGRNWSIFWLVVGSIGGTLYYDRHQRKAIREQWKEKVSFLSQQPMDPLAMPRKVTVYITPPPGDFLENGLREFRQYVKPLLTAAAVDFDVVKEDRQGEIRVHVADEIREKRRRAEGLSEPTERELFDEKVSKKLVPDKTGGVICIGRGAYKEYLNGLQEGWFGPLEKPEWMAKEEESAKEVKAELKTDHDVEAKESTKADLSEKVENLDDIKDVPQEQAKESTDTPESSEEDPDKPKKKPPVPKPYIRPSQYSEATPGKGFDSEEFQPILVVPFPHLLGFANTPIRIYRWFNRRHLADQVCSSASQILLQAPHAFSPEDVNLEKSEELTWPKKWKKENYERNSEWVQEFVVDPRLAAKLKVYNVEPATESNEKSNAVVQAATESNEKST